MLVVARVRAAKPASPPLKARAAAEASSGVRNSSRSTQFATALASTIADHPGGLLRALAARGLVQQAFADRLMNGIAPRLVAPPCRISDDVAEAAASGLARSRRRTLRTSATKPWASVALSEMITKPKGTGWP